MEIPTQQNHVYTLTCDNACEVYDVDTDRLIHEHHAGEVQSQFTAIGMKVSLTDDTAHITELFNGAPAGNGGGGYIESNLNVGHGAADAVAAVCTLTLGDPTAEGDLTDNAGHALPLDPQPAAQSHGVLTVADATEGGTLTIGETELPAFAEKKETPASISLALNDFYSTFGQFEFGVKYQGEDLYDFAWMNPPEEVTPADLETALNDADNWHENGEQMTEAPFEATWDSATEKMTLTALAKSGEDSNNLTYEAYTMTPFVDPADPSFSGGQDARTMEEAVNMVANAINLAAGEDVEAVADYENNAVNVTALEAGAAGDLLAFEVAGDLLEVTEQMDGGQDARTYAEVIAEINGDDGESEPTYPMGVKAEATETEGTITLTANEAGADANSIVYTAAGCFGNGTVKQGSTTRGKNAVEQTAFKIYLNGDEFTGGGLPVPTALTPTTAMQHGGVYTVEVDGTAQDFSAVAGPPAGGSARVFIKVGYTVAEVKWPAWRWMTSGGAEPTLTRYTMFHFDVAGDGTAVAVTVDSYAWAPKFTYTALTSNDWVDGAALNLLTEYTSPSTEGSTYSAHFAFSTAAANAYKSIPGEKTADGKYGPACVLNKRVVLRAWEFKSAMWATGTLRGHIEGWDYTAQEWVQVSEEKQLGKTAWTSNVLETNVDLLSDKWRLVCTALNAGADEVFAVKNTVLYVL